MTQPLPTAPSSTGVAPRPRGRAARRIGAALLVLGVLFAVAGVAVRAKAHADAKAAFEPVEAPGAVRVDLTSGRHGVYIVDGKSSSGFDVTIAGPDDQKVEYQRYGFYGSDASIPHDGDDFYMEGYFEAPTSGRYEVTFADRTGDSYSSGRVAAGIGPDDDFDLPVASALLWLAAFVLFVIGVITGFVGVLLGIGKRQSATPPPPAGPPPPPPGASSF